MFLFFFFPDCFCYDTFHGKHERDIYVKGS